jgi:hypothetical protein
MFLKPAGKADIVAGDQGLYAEVAPAGASPRAAAAAPQAGSRS